ncbi:MAG: hypothetical protein ABJG78_04605 [Cyclobacteriaceae bacterium]
MARHHPGVEEIQLFVVLADVVASDKKDERFINQTEKIFHGISWINLKTIVVKGNIGRDLSSAKVGLDEISNYAGADDAVLVRNRSSIGPFKKNWYGDYLELFDFKANIGLVGNTINLKYHPDVDPDRVAPHVQTYMYLSSFRVLDKLRENFPGIHEVNRLKIICDGEIAISEKIMDMGYEIVSLFWPTEYFGRKIAINEGLPQTDIKIIAKGQPFMHRYGVAGFLKYHFQLVGWLRFIRYTFRTKSRKKVPVRKLDLFY